MKLRFVHLADLHLGSFREKRLTQLNFRTFKKAIQKIIEEKVDFVLFSGDIFNNAMPPIEIVTQFVSQIKILKQKNIPLYCIGGSHDYSHSGKSFLQLLNQTGVLIDVAKFLQLDKNKIELQFTKNEELKINLAGVLGKKNGLDKNIYENLNKQTLSKEYLNIFMFHTTLNDFKPQSLNVVKSEVTTKYLPQGFDYYAGGHIHKNMTKTFEDNSTISYSGALFPNNFKELKKEKPCFNICEFNFENRRTFVKKIVLDVYEKEYLYIEAKEENPVELKNKIEEKFDTIDCQDKIILLEISGIVEGKISDIGLNKIVSKIYDKGALQILKNTYKLKSSLIENIEIRTDENALIVEERIITEHLKEKSKEEFDKYYNLTKDLLKLELIKQDGEKVAQFEERVIKEIDGVVR